MTMTVNERVAAWRLRNPIRRREQDRKATARYRSKSRQSGKLKPFIGIDGEGAGTDEQGRQNYLLMRAVGGLVSRSLFCGNNRLSTASCLDFILGLPADAILVGYYFTYDATQILRDLPDNRLQRLFADRDINEKQSRYTYWGRYAIEFVSRQYFRVALVEDNGHGRTVVKNSARTINEVGGFFQKSFVEALKQWNIGDPTVIDIIAAGKDRRSEFVEMTDIEREYCRLECKMLARLMERLREVCIASNIYPTAWRGAGSLAAALYRDHNAPTKKTRPARSKKLEAFASAAYYGGRFEITKVGRIPGPIYEYDINSAYPAAMLKLPCPWHTKWKPFKGEPDHDGLYLADITFEHNADVSLCGFPVRDSGRLYWPRAASGRYWSPEIEAAIRNGARISDWRSAYVVDRQCSCDPYAWVRELYDYRKSLGKSDRGFALKLAINALYGKLAQRLGGAPYRDMIAAGLITAFCRAQLMEAYFGNKEHIIMLATDGLFSRMPLAVDLGSGIGQWEAKVRSGGMFVVQPGIYWSIGDDVDILPKTRGIPRSRIIAFRGQFERIFDAWSRGDGDDAAPSLKVPVPMFVAHRLALARGKPQLAGCWLNGEKQVSFDWGNKRLSQGYCREGFVETVPYAGSPALISQPYDPSILTDLQEQLLDTEGAPDYEPWGNSGE